MSTSVAQRAGVQVLHVTGDLAGRNVGQFQRAVEPPLSRSEREFVVDLSDSTAVDSAGLEALTKLQRECEGRLGGVKLCGVGATWETVLVMTRLLDRFERYATVDAAVESFA